MARFYFDFHERGSVMPDCEGIEADGLDGARRLALHAARDIMSEEVRTGVLSLDCHIAILDDRRTSVAEVRFRDAVSVRGLDILPQ